MTANAVLTHRGRVAALSRSRSTDDPELLAARASLSVEVLAAYIDKTLRAAPPLTGEQRDRLVLLLRPSTSGGVAA